MAKFRIETDGGTYEVEADDEAMAVKAVETITANPSEKLAYGQAPEGMVLDPQTGQMVDAKAIADQKGGSMVGAWIKGMPFIGEYADELVGGGDPVKTEVAREMQKKAEQENPKTAIAGKLATGLTALPAAVMASRLLPGIGGAGLAAGVASGLGYGTVGGAVEGAISGYGAGNTPESRLSEAQRGAVVGGAIGGVVGGAAPLVAAGAGKVARKFLDNRSVNQEARKIGVSRPAADIVTDAMRADDTLGAAGGRNMMRSGADAMLADAGGTAQSLLDTSIQRSGEGARIASKAVLDRADKASGRLKLTMDGILGVPEGTNKAARDIAAKSAKARDFAYKYAYSRPIDYAASTGRQIEDVISRIPPNTLQSAIDEANAAMRAAGTKNQQILADIAEDGSIVFREMPNVQQLDEIKKALGTIGRESVDQFGRATAQGARAKKLARELRDAVVDAVPSYKSAVKLGGDKIAEDEALEIGTKLLRPGMTREAVRDAVKGMTDAERKQLALGLRQHIDDTMANVTRVMSDPNVDAREAAKILKDLSSRAAKEKVTLALGEAKAKTLFRELDRASAALDLKAATSQNSKTFARMAADDKVKANRGGVLDAMLEGRPFEAPRRAWQELTGATDQARRASDDKLYAEISSLLTGPRGADAMRALQSLLDIYRTGAANQATARNVGRGVAAGVSLPAYQTGTQLGEDLLRPQGQ